MGTDTVDEDEIMDNKGKKSDFYNNYILFLNVQTFHPKTLGQNSLYYPIEKPIGC